MFLILGFKLKKNIKGQLVIILRNKGYLVYLSYYAYFTASFEKGSKYFY